jgi:hypothetical protein
VAYTLPTAAPRDDLPPLWLLPAPSLPPAVVVVADAPVRRRAAAAAMTAAQHAMARCAPILYPSRYTSPLSSCSSE